MLSYLRPYAQVSKDELSDLERRMIAWYDKAPSDYYRIADAGKNFQDRAANPFHMDLLDQISVGSHVCEFGCGTGAFGREVLRKRANYTGLEWSEARLLSNRQDHPDGRFLRPDQLDNEQFDVVFSQYVIEHVAHPMGHLAAMWTHCRPSGFVAVICPDFINCGSLPASVYCGQTPRRFSQKLSACSFKDAFLHLWDLKAGLPRWQTQALQAPAETFWMNPHPRILEGGAYSIDADAIHLPRFEDLHHWFIRHRGQIVQSSETLENVDPAARRFNMYLLVRKP